MSSRTWGSRTLAASLVCGVARPAFADGAIPSEHEINVFLLKVGLVALAIVVVFVGLIWFSRRVRTTTEQPAAQPPEAELPAARTVRER